MSDYDPNYTPEKNHLLVGVKIILLNEKNEVLVLKRSEKISRPHGWDFPGGGVDKNEQPTDAAIRELFEETGLSISEVHLFTSKLTNDGDLILGFFTTSESPDIHLSWEHESFSWISVELVGDLDLPELHRSIYEDYKNGYLEVPQRNGMHNSNIADFFLEGTYVFDSYAPFQIEWRGKLWPTAEHAFQAAHFFDTNPELAEQVRLTKSPREADDFANENKQFDDPNWRDKRVAIMTEIVKAKHDQHPLIQKTLKEIGNRQIVETNDSDDFWGWGPDHNGQNQLGKIWMKIRSEVGE